MLLFIDESGTDRRQAPYEVLAGVAVREADLWNLIQAVRSSEREHFGMILAEAGVEFKGSHLLKRRVFRFAQQSIPLGPEERTRLTRSFLEKGIRAAGRRGSSGANRDEFTAYGQAVLRFVSTLIEICGRFRVKTFASMVSRTAARPADRAFLRKDYAYLFERYFYYLEDIGSEEVGLVVFDEVEKAQARTILDQMEGYFMRTQAGRTRSGRIVPEPFFVHSDLTTAVQLADIVAYCLNWGTRLNRMTEATRPEIEPYANEIFQLRYVGQRTSGVDGAVWPTYGIIYIDDLRPSDERTFV